MNLKQYRSNPKRSVFFLPILSLMTPNGTCKIAWVSAYPPSATPAKNAVPPSNPLA